MSKKTVHVRGIDSHAWDKIRIEVLQRKGADPQFTTARLLEEMIETFFQEAPPAPHAVLFCSSCKITTGFDKGNYYYWKSGGELVRTSYPQEKDCPLCGQPMTDI